MSETDIVKSTSDSLALSMMNLDQLKSQVNAVHEMMRTLMTEKTHYGLIPGCGNKFVLFKAGAEKICMTFGFVPQYKLTRSDLADNHREYEVICTLNNRQGQLIGQGVGECSTMEAKYRYRAGEVKSTGRAVPEAYWQLRKSQPIAAQEMLGGAGFQTKKVDGLWEIVIKGDRIEHNNPADHYNTVLKMAKKRAYVDATISCASVSDLFTQDIEDPVAIDAGGVVNVPEPRKHKFNPASQKQIDFITKLLESDHVKPETRFSTLDKIAARAVSAELAAQLIDKLKSVIHEGEQKDSKKADQHQEHLPIIDDDIPFGVVTDDDTVPAEGDY